MVKYTPPSYKTSAFNCPFCGAFSNQIWGHGCSITNSHYPQNNLFFAHCSHCNNFSIWVNGSMVYPNGGNAPLPNQDLPKDIIEDYEEAREILNKSSRGAAALLRLSIQKLCKHLGESGENINKDIGNLVQKGLPATIQKALDIVRVIGNNAVHPGQIDLKDNSDTASKLFVLINVIADSQITQPKEIDKLFDSLPENQKKGIEDRDKKKIT